MTEVYTAKLNAMSEKERAEANRKLNAQFKEINVDKAHIAKKKQRQTN